MLTCQWVSEQFVAALPGASVDVKDLKGSGDHFEARIVSTAFVGKTMVEQHQLAYAALRGVLSTGELHALVLKTFTPESWEKAKSRNP
jgi:acid stress-induced BolA-like protein IbaG/YrbA